MFRIPCRNFVFPIRCRAFRCVRIIDHDQCTSAKYCSVVICRVKYMTAIIFLLLLLNCYVSNLSVNSKLALNILEGVCVI
ncbi:hypothetical protein DL98DRAFT_284797 [Cadophora sp. DSE1049]|nr:hypothetical protein DL98DRAFT_284797 [Cadophora sp. DSE1049]